MENNEEPKFKVNVYRMVIEVLDFENTSEEEVLNEVE